MKISTLSPVFNGDSSATSFPFTFAPMHRWPTSVWTA